MATSSTNFKALLAQAADQSASLASYLLRTHTGDADKRNETICRVLVDAQKSHSPHQCKVNSFQNNIQTNEDAKTHSSASAHGKVQDSRKATFTNLPSILPPTTGAISSLSTGSTSKRFDMICLALVKSLSIPRTIDRNSTMTIPRQQRHPTDIHLRLPILFRSLCICEFNKLSGHPIQLKSKYFTIGPRGLKVGACEFVNLAYDNQSGRFCEVSSRPDIDGRPKFILEYADTLVSSETGLPTWVISAQIDITDIIHKLAILSESQRSQSSQPQRSKHHGDPKESSDENDAIQNVKTDSAIVIEYDHETRTETYSLGMHANLPFLFYKSDGDELSDDREAWIDWVEAACSTPNNGEISSKRNQKISYSCKAGVEVNSRIATAFSNLVQEVSFLHRSCFVLAASADIGKRKSSISATHWQIAFVSPYLFSRPVDRPAALLHTPVEKLQDLGILLSGDRPTSFLVNWGQNGILKRLYCSPMFRGDCINCWLCFLVDPGLGDLW